MLNTRSFASIIVLVFSCSAADAQIKFERVARFDSPNERARRFTGGREVEFTDDGETLIAAFYGSTAQLYDLKANVPIGKPIRTAGDGEVGFVNNEVAYTADWDSVRLWDAESGQQIGEAIPHELREDTIIRPAFDSKGKLIATRATMQSVQLRRVSTRKLIGAPLNFPAIVQSIEFSDEGALLFVRSGGLLHVLDAGTAKMVVGPINAGWPFKYFSKQQKLVSTEPLEGGLFQLVIRSTDQQGWPESGRFDLPGKLKRLIAFGDDAVMVQTTEQDYTPRFFTLELTQSPDLVEVEWTADRAFRVVATEDNNYWICSNIRNVSCYRFGETEPVWRKQIAGGGYDQQLYSLSDTHFIMCDKQENFGVYRVSDGTQVWTQAGMRRFSLTDHRIAFGTSAGVEVWAME